MPLIQVVSDIPGHTLPVLGQRLEILISHLCRYLVTCMNKLLRSIIPQSPDVFF